MKIDEAKKLIKETFQNSYDEGKFKYFIKNLFKYIEERDNTYSEQFIKKAYKDHIKSYKRLYKYQDSLHNEKGKNNTKKLYSFIS